MKGILVASMILGPAILLTGCSGSSDSPVPPETETPEPEMTEIRISPSVIESRATDYDFEQGDCIGLYVVNYSGSTPGMLADSGNYVDNMRFTYDGTWTPDTPVFWNDDKTRAGLYLYYPYTSVHTVTAHPFTVMSDQSTEAAYKASDFMAGRVANVVASGNATVIPVSHVMSRIVITLEAGKGFTAESLAAADVSVRINGVKCGSTIDLSTGRVTPAGTATSVIPLYADNTYKALIVPQTVSESNLITVRVDGRDFNLNRAFTFESAHSHKFTITLSKFTTGVNVNITPWIEDGKDHGGTAI